MLISRALLALMPLAILMAITAIGAPRVTAGDEAVIAEHAAVAANAVATGTVEDPAQAPAAAVDQALTMAAASPDPEPPGAAPPAADAPDATPPAPSDQTSSNDDAAEPAPPGEGGDAGPSGQAAEPRADDEAAEPDPDAGAADQAPPHESAAPAPQDEEAEDPPAADEPPSLSVAQNVSLVFQVLWQLQHGCETYCYGTSQSQSASQEASTTQYAEAGGALGGPGAAAEAGNLSRTVQFIWQYQAGCVAFCYDTSQTQSAVQTADTMQIAIALAGLTALAQNVAETLQFAWQTQVGCARECHGAAQSQSLAQTQSTSQAALAAPGEAPAEPVMLPQVAGAVGELPLWLIALAANAGATIQTIYQLQLAACLSECTGDTQAQLASQSAATAQLAVAVAGAGEPPAAPPVDAEPEPPAAPVEQAPGAEPPAAEALAASAVDAGASAPASSPAAGTPARANAPRRPRDGEWLPGRDARPHRRAGERLASGSRDERLASGSGGGAPAPGTGRAAASRPATRDGAVRSGGAARVPGGRDGAGRAGDAAAVSTVTRRTSGTASSSLLEVSAEESSRWLLIALLAASLAFVAGVMALRQLQSPRSR